MENSEMLMKKLSRNLSENGLPLSKDFKHAALLGYRLASIQRAVHAKIFTDQKTQDTISSFLYKFANEYLAEADKTTDPAKTREVGDKYAKMLGNILEREYKYVEKNDDLLEIKLSDIKPWQFM